MKSSKALIYLLLSILSANAYADFAVINDQDGYTNVRSGANATSNILYTLNNSDIFFCFNNMANEYYSIVSPKSRHQKESEIDYEFNYIHKSRVRLISSYPKLSVTKKVTDKQISFSAHGYVIDITIKPFNKKLHVITYNKDDKYSITKLDNYKIVWGTDQGIPLQEYMDFKISYNNVISTIPRKVLGDLFNPHTYAMNAYYDAVSQNIYIVSTNGDGAGVYNLVFVINKGQFVKRLVLLNENV